MKPFFRMLALACLIHRACASTTPVDLTGIAGDPAWKRQPQLVEDLTSRIMDDTVSLKIANQHVERSPNGLPYLVVPLGPVLGANHIVFLMDEPKITADHYALTGELACHGVDGKCHLELGSVLGDITGESLSSPVIPVHGNEAFHSFALPFVAFDPTGLKDPRHKLMRLLLWLILANHEAAKAKPMAGEIYLRNLKLVQYPDVSTAAAAAIPTSPPPEGRVVTTLQPKGSEPSVNPELIVNLTQKGSTTHFWLTRPLLASTSFPPIQEYNEDGLREEIGRRAFLNPQFSIVIRADKTVPKDISRRILDFCRGKAAQKSALVYADAPQVVEAFFTTTPSGVKLSMLGVDYTSMAAFREGLQNLLRIHPQPILLIHLTEPLQWPRYEPGLNDICQKILPGGFEITWPPNPPASRELSPPKLSGSSSASEIPIPKNNTFRQKYFWLGVITVLVLELVLGVAFVLALRWNRFRHQRELLRIASLDG